MSVVSVLKEFSTKSKLDKTSTCKYASPWWPSRQDRGSRYPRIAESTAKWALDSYGAGRLIMYSLVDRNPRFPSERPYSRRRPSRHTSIVSAPVQAEHLVSLVHKSPTAHGDIVSICIAFYSCQYYRHRGLGSFTSDT